jgi:zinc protease
MKNTVQTFKTNSGIEVWLVTQKRLPIIALQWQVQGGSCQDAAAQAGRTYFMTSLLDEGAGDMDATAFQEALEDKAIELSFDTEIETVGGSLKTLSENKEKAFKLLELALKKPRFDAQSVERVREQITQSLKRAQTNPQARAHIEFWQKAYPNHGFGLPTKGTVETVAALNAAHFKAAHKAQFSKASLKVAIVGDIEQAEASEKVEHLFQSFSNTPVTPTQSHPMNEKGTHIVPLSIPQTQLQFGFKAYERHHKDFMALFVMNHILGGGTFTARLMKEVREKRGLTYGIYTHIYPLTGGSVMIGGLSTGNDKAKEALSVTIEEMQKLIVTPVGQEELTSAKNYLIGSYALRFESSNAIAQNLLRLMRDGFSPDYMVKRNEEIEAVTQEDILRVSKDVLRPENLLILGVGAPEGLGDIAH